MIEEKEVKFNRLELAPGDGLVFKVMSPDDWSVFSKSGVFEGSKKDIEDSYIHMSTFEQVSGVVDRYYSESFPLYVLAYEQDVLGDHIKWEAASSGDKFPHYYSSLQLKQVKGIEYFEGSNLLKKKFSKT